MKEESDQKKAKALLAWYNAVPNGVWSIINLAPVFFFCYNFMESRTIISFVAISFIPAFVKKTAFDRLQISTRNSTYKRLYVPEINRVIQNGVIINALVRKRFPGYRQVSPDKASILKLINKTYDFERFHAMMFVFFILTSGYAVSIIRFDWAFLILITNIIYNIYPNLLQQYIRLKLSVLNQRL